MAVAEAAMEITTIAVVVVIKSRRRHRPLLSNLPSQPPFRGRDDKTLIRLWWWGGGERLWADGR